MQLDWSTFILEILNFLILVWILKRFLYKPILTMIAERKAAIEQTLATSERTQKEAQALREQYEHRQADWQREKETARAHLLEESPRSATDSWPRFRRHSIMSANGLPSSPNSIPMKWLGRLRKPR